MKKLYKSFDPVDSYRSSVIDTRIIKKEGELAKLQNFKATACVEQRSASNSVKIVFYCEYTPLLKRRKTQMFFLKQTFRKVDGRAIHTY
ncbi:MAG: hypothetical protein P9X24_02195 [Candidatus Hatepunaea meridiana]|nr:hypothetical protein [Candidatus Hatepunaea meridiana]